jgi:small subunit ribosomal protein S19
MTRSLKKGYFLDPRLMRKLVNAKPSVSIKTWARGCDISPEMVGFTFEVHNGKIFIPVFVTEDMVGHKLGEFSLTRKFTRHGGKMQKELDMKKKESEIAAAKASSASADAKATGPKKK